MGFLGFIFLIWVEVWFFLKIVVDVVEISFEGELEIVVEMIGLREVFRNNVIGLGVFFYLILNIIELVGLFVRIEDG